MGPFDMTRDQIEADIETFEILLLHTLTSVEQGAVARALASPRSKLAAMDAPGVDVRIPVAVTRGGIVATRHWSSLCDDGGETAQRRFPEDRLVYVDARVPLPGVTETVVEGSIEDV